MYYYFCTIFESKHHLSYLFNKKDPSDTDKSSSPHFILSLFFLEPRKCAWDRVMFLKKSFVCSYCPSVHELEIKEAAEQAAPEESGTSPALQGEAGSPCLEMWQEHYPPPLMMCCRRAGSLPVGHPSLLDVSIVSTRRRLCNAPFPAGLLRARCPLTACEAHSLPLLPGTPRGSSQTSLPSLGFCFFLDMFYTSHLAKPPLDTSMSLYIFKLLMWHASQLAHSFCWIEPQYIKKRISMCKHKKNQNTVEHLIGQLPSTISALASS